MDLKQIIYEDLDSHVASGEGQVSGSCENGNEPTDSIKCEEFLN